MTRSADIFTLEFDLNLDCPVYKNHELLHELCRWIAVNRDDDTQLDFVYEAAMTDKTEEREPEIFRYFGSAREAVLAIDAAGPSGIRLVDYDCAAKRLAQLSALHKDMECWERESPRLHKIHGHKEVIIRDGAVVAVKEHSRAARAWLRCQGHDPSDYFLRPILGPTPVIPAPAADAP